MIVLKFYLAYLLLVLQTYSVFGQETEKGSLALVIDDSASMHDEIQAVKDTVDSIFDTVINANYSNIENFVLVTFNDPDVKLRTVTNDRNAIKTALNEIVNHQGGDCPEFALTGVKLALEKSLPNSFIYVFTDASASDYTMLEDVKTIAKTKKTRIYFILTGSCGDKQAADYQVYYQLASATRGQVFEGFKHNVKDIIPIAIEFTKSVSVFN